MVLSAAGCGRFGVHLLRSEQSSEPDAGACHGVCATYRGVLDCSSNDSCMLRCENGYADCDGSNSNGCEVSTQDSVDMCGSCSLGCENSHASVFCEQGVCMPSCDVGYGDCDADPSNGCEAPLDDPRNCRACGVACENPHGSTRCEAAGCTPECDTGYADCDGAPETGCETALGSHPAHCGACDRACDVGTEVCRAGRCEASGCEPGRAECDGDMEVVCETDTRSSAQNCGSCGHECTVERGSASCEDSVCQIAGCDVGFADCDGSYDNGCEIALASSASHCGACGTTCTNAHGSTRCDASECVPACSTGYGDCDGDAANGCETPLDTIADCGACDRSCSAAGGTALCSAGVCETRCDLSGTFALKLTVPVTWPGSAVLAAGNGTFVFWAALQLSHSGTTLSGSLVPCGETIPDFASTPLINERYAVTLPTGPLDAAPFPSTSISATLSASTVGANIDFARAAWLVGAQLNEPAFDAWPSRTAISPVDMDGDGAVAVTYRYQNDDGYSHVPADGLGTARASLGYIASRVVFTLRGTLGSCTQSSGSATAPDVDAHTLGCRLTGGSSCSGTQAGYLDSNGPDWAPQASSYALEKVSASATCAEVRATLP